MILFSVLIVGLAFWWFVHAGLLLLCFVIGLCVSVGGCIDFGLWLECCYW